MYVATALTMATFLFLPDKNVYKKIAFRTFTTNYLSN